MTSEELREAYHRQRDEAFDLFAALFEAQKKIKKLEQERDEARNEATFWRNYKKQEQ
jgi:hypothetical protein